MRVFFIYLLSINKLVCIATTFKKATNSFPLPNSAEKASFLLKGGDESAKLILMVIFCINVLYFLFAALFYDIIYIQSDNIDQRSF